MAKKDKAKKNKKAKGGTGDTATTSLRATGAKVMDALNHPLIADIAAAALIAAAAALRDNKQVRSTAAKAGRKAAEVARDTEQGAVKLATGKKTGGKKAKA